MSWGAVIGGAIAGGAALIGGNKAAKASTRATDATVAEQARQYDQTRADFAPYRGLGNAAIADINRLYGRGTASQPLPYEQWAAQQGAQPQFVTNNGRGAFFDSIRAASNWSQGTSRDAYDAYVRDFMPTTTGGGKPDMSVFFESPDYQFNLAEGQKAIDRSLLARGRGLSGAALRGGVRYAQGLASTEFNNFYNRLASQAGLGQAASGSTAAAGAAAAGNIGNAYMANGANQASAYMNTAAGVNNAAQGAMSNYLLMRYLGQGGGTGAGIYSGNPGYGVPTSGMYA